VASVSELIDRGIKLYMAGRVRDAREAFQLALDLDPANAKARAYLAHIRETSGAKTPSSGAERAAPPPGGATPRPAPRPDAAEVPGPDPIRADPAASGAARDGNANAPAAAAGAPAWAAVPLPAPSAQAPESPEAVGIAQAAGAAQTVAAASAPPASQAAPVAPGAPIPLPAPSRVAAHDPLHAEDDPAGDDYAPSPWDEGPAAPATIQLDSTVDGIDLEAVAEKSDLQPLVPEGARPAASASAPKSDVEVWLSAAKELFSLGDFSGSLELIEKILQVDPDHGEARDYLRHNEATLVSMYESKLGPLTRIPRLAIKPEEVMWLNLDHRAGFLLAQIDGTVDFESLFALSGLPRLDTARILANLIADGVITT
jgi:tetratricopeptide (TPR) repeat protein